MSEPRPPGGVVGVREEILARLRAAGGDPDVRVPRDYRRRPAGVSRADVVTRFVERVGGYGAPGPDRAAAVRHVGADELPTAVAAALWGRQAKRIVVPADLPYGWLAALDGVQVLADVPALDLATLCETDGVVTGCSAAIAETGTIVLDGGRAQGRRELTLVPGYFLCVVHAGQIAGTLPEALARVGPHRPLAWIGGPRAGRSIEVLVVED